MPTARHSSLSFSRRPIRQEGSASASVSACGSASQISSFARASTQAQLTMLGVHNRRATQAEMRRRGLKAAERKKASVVARRELPQVKDGKSLGPPQSLPKSCSCLAVQDLPKLKKTLWRYRQCTRKIKGPPRGSNPAPSAYFMSDRR